jgi:hypothetical protein
MINGLANKIECDICGGTLKFSATSTIDDYTTAITANTTNFFDKVEEIIGKYLVYECHDCKAKYKYTYKDLEKALRKDLTQRMLMLLVKDVVTNSNAFQDKFFFYCGKCTGYTGTGCCPKTVYNNCEIKRFPLNEP